MASPNATVSEQEVRSVAVLRAGGWLTANELAVAADIAPRTARAYLLRLVRAGVVDQAATSPGLRYRWSPDAVKRDPAYVARIDEIAAVFEDGRRTP